MGKYILSVSLLSIVIIALTLGNIPQPEKVVIIPRIVIIEKPVEVIREVEKPIYLPLSITATPEELDTAFKAIDYGIYAHQLYADNPSLQTPETGGTETQLMWVGYYKLIKKLLGRAYT